MGICDGTRQLGFLRSYICDCTISVSQLVNFAFKLQNSCRLILQQRARSAASTGAQPC